MQPLGRIFEGVTKSPARRFIKQGLAALREYYPRLLLPCIGMFTEAHLAKTAGYEPRNVHTSDIGLFSSILGYLYSGQPLDGLHAELSPAVADKYGGLADDYEQAAYLLWIIKCKQIKATAEYARQFATDLQAREKQHRDTLAEQLRSHAKALKGIAYQVQDVRTIIGAHLSAHTLVVLNPALYSRGYEKMFATQPGIVFNPGVTQLNWKKEYEALYLVSKQSPALFLWTCAGPVPQSACRDIVYSREASRGRFEHWLCTRPDELLGRGVRRRIDYRSAAAPHPAGRVIDVDYELSPESAITFRPVDKNVALYYRDLFAHKMGSTRAQLYFLMLIDGYVFGTVGFVIRDVLRLVDTDIAEVFGFSNPLRRYPGSNRLLMMAITCTAMRDILAARERRNRIFEMKGLETTCLCKYRKLKYHRGLLAVANREKLDGGNYRLQVRTDWHERDFAQCMRDFLEEQTAAKEKPRAS